MFVANFYSAFFFSESPPSLFPPPLATPPPPLSLSLSLPCPLVSAEDSQAVHVEAIGPSKHPTWRRVHTWFASAPPGPSLHLGSWDMFPEGISLRFQVRNKCQIRGSVSLPPCGRQRAAGPGSGGVKLLTMTVKTTCFLGLPRCPALRTFRTKDMHLGAAMASCGIGVLGCCLDRPSPHRLFVSSSASCGSGSPRCTA